MNYTPFSMILSDFSASYKWEKNLYLIYWMLVMVVFLLKKVKIYISIYLQIYLSLQFAIQRSFCSIPDVHQSYLSLDLQNTKHFLFNPPSLEILGKITMYDAAAMYTSIIEQGFASLKSMSSQELTAARKVYSNMGL